MSEHVVQIADGFWNIRGDFKVFGFLNIGTQASLLRRNNGSFVLLDSYTMQGAVKQRIDALSNNGIDIEAVINLHPFHTVHVENTHALYPNAKLYGTQRHIEKFPDLPWQRELTESDACAQLFADDLDFSVPAGVDFISRNEHLHFSSVLAYHRASKTIHSDDTLMYLRLPGLLGKLKKPKVSFHMTLAKTLQERQGAAAEFRIWATELAKRWNAAENLCAAHSAAVTRADAGSQSISDSILVALQDVEETLQAHEKKFG